MSVPLTDKWIEQQLELCRKATSAPWQARHRHVHATLHDDEMSGLGWEIDGPPQPMLRGTYAKAADAHLIAAAPEGYPLVLKELQRLRNRRCANCEFYAYYDGPLCGFSVDTDESFLWHHDPDTWYCADWKPREEAANDRSE